ncbi:MAG: pyridoxamine 5'-phosphate oxidase family protein [Thiobacillaceae bacterium]|jgi:hypothetical protein|nr:pyridoxamine 5'-phosphate oxidase family protein [Thiobacillaceae bacterium]
MSELGEEARRLVRGQRNGVLSTLSQRLAGYPFGSVAPFVLDHPGRPVILVSGLAEHTRNMLADPRVSLIVQPCAEDMQQAGRVTLLGEAERLPDKEGFAPRYLRHQPQAEVYLDMADFAFYRVEPARVRFIGGFGKIHWIEPSAYLANAARLAVEEEDLLAELNAAHRHDLVACCRQVRGIETDAAELIGVDPDGCDVRAAGRLLRFDFPASVSDARGVRAALTDLARRGRP